MKSWVPVGLMVLWLYGCSTTMDAVSSATVRTTGTEQRDQNPNSRVLIILASPSGNTAKLAEVMAKALTAQVLSPEQALSKDLQMYRLVGFGSGILNQKHNQSLLEFAAKLHPGANTKAFIFSTSGVSRQFALDHNTEDTHTPLREILKAKGLDVVGEFNCEGFNQNSFLILFGGMNKGRPNEQDLRNAEEFALSLQ